MHDNEKKQDETAAPAGRPPTQEELAQMQLTQALMVLLNGKPVAVAGPSLMQTAAVLAKQMPVAVSREAFLEQAGIFYDQVKVERPTIVAPPPGMVVR